MHRSGSSSGLALKQDLRPFGGRPLLTLLAMGVLETAGILLFSLALFSSSISVLPITTTVMGVVFTVGFARAFLKERVEASYALGVLVLIASVAALLYFTA